MTSLGKIPSAGTQKLTAFTCPPGAYITQLKGVSNANGAMGLQATCSGVGLPTTNSSWWGTQQGDPFVFSDPSGMPGVYATGSKKPPQYTSSVGPTQTAALGVKGPEVWANMVCPAGAKLSGWTVTADDARILSLQNAKCIVPPVPAPPPAPQPSTQSCPKGEVINRVSAYVDAGGNLIGSRFGCTNSASWLPWLGASKGGTAKLTDGPLRDVRGVKGFEKVALLGQTSPCSADSAFNTVQVEFGAPPKVTPSKCTVMPVIIPVVPPETNSSQYKVCPTGSYINAVDTRSGTTGLGMMFTCGPKGTSPAAYTTSQFGPRVGIAGHAEAEFGYGQVDYTVDSAQGVTSLTMLGNTLGSKVGTARTFSCPAGQIINGVTGNWSPQKTTNLTFFCAPPPYKVADVPVEAPIPVPLPEDVLPTPPPPIVADPTVPPAVPPEPEVISVEPPMYVPEPIPDYTVTVPTLDLTSNTNAIIIFLFFLVMVAIAVLVVSRYRRAVTVPQTASAPTA